MLSIIIPVMRIIDLPMAPWRRIEFSMSANSIEVDLRVLAGSLLLADTFFIAPPKQGNVHVYKMKGILMYSGAEVIECTRDYKLIIILKLYPGTKNALCLDGCVCQSPSPRTGNAPPGDTMFA